MTQIIISLLAFAVAIGVLVAFHEFGHFWVARRLGVKVLRFSIGFGKPLLMWRSRRDEVEYALSALPLGGYVRMLDEREGEVSEAERHLAFNRQPVWKRILIVVAGPVFNFIFAIIAYWLVFMIGITGIKPIIGEVGAHSIAQQAGLASGDRIVMVNNHAVSTWDEARTALLRAALGGDRVRLKIHADKAGDHDVTLNVKGVSDDPKVFFDAVGLHPMEPTLKPVIGRVLDGGAAQAGGLKVGDRVISAQGDPIETWRGWVHWVRARPDKIVSVEVMRGGQQVALTLHIGSQQAGNHRIGHIGAAVKVDKSAWDGLTTEVRYDPFTAVGAGVMRTWGMSALTVELLARMVVGQVSWHNVSGPINIAQYAGYSAQLGLVPFLSFLAIVSISLGVLNLLPVPVLDGGNLLYYVVELITGRPLSERAQMFGQQIGIALLLMLMSLAFYNDITRLVG